MNNNCKLKHRMQWQSILFNFCYSVIIMQIWSTSNSAVIKVKNSCDHIAVRYFSHDNNSTSLCVSEDGNEIVTKCNGRCKNGRNDNFGLPFTKPPKYLLFCIATVAKGIMLCSQHIVLVIQTEFPPKRYQVTLPLTRKEKLPNYQLKNFL